MKQNPNQFRNAEVVSVEKALLDKLEAIEKQHPKTFKGKEGSLKNHVILTYPAKDNDYQYLFSLRPNSGLPQVVQKKVTTAFKELQALLAERAPNHAHPPAGTLNM
jgi:hypothetical protein